MQLHFDERDSWRDWLQKNHDKCGEVWLVFFKKHTGKTNIGYDAAVEEALCYGWIDSIIKRLDDDRYARKFTPRTNTTKWSTMNLKRARALVASGRMTDAGQAKLPGDMQPQAAVSSRPLSVPPFFTVALARHPSAGIFFDQLAPSYRRNIIHWVCSAKRADTQKRRLAEVISLLAEGKKLGMK
jgi:uncharacterized protein YdeI (YjbR/CyaY-like superfamily)